MQCNMIIVYMYTTCIYIYIYMYGLGLVSDDRPVQEPELGGTQIERRAPRGWTRVGPISVLRRWISEGLTRAESKFKG